MKKKRIQLVLSLLSKKTDLYNDEIAIDFMIGFNRRGRERYCSC